MSPATSMGTVLCFGEVLWDNLPTGKFPGGAPLNVAYHARVLGLEPLLISALGEDREGQRLRSRLAAWGLDLSCLTHNRRPTGSVSASLDAGGEPLYVIADDVAWDEIALTGVTCLAAATARALVFGTLAQRSPGNQRTLERLRALLGKNAEVVYDVNLRAPFYDLDQVRDLAKHCTVLKVNAAEAALLGGLARWPGPEEAARKLSRRFSDVEILLTAGAEGAGLLREEIWHWEPARPAAVVDPVGAGDAFLAGFLAARLSGHAPGTCVAAGCRQGEWVVSQFGATPEPPSTRMPTR